MNEKNYQMILEDATVRIKKAHSVLLAVCTAIQSGAAVDALMPALWDVEWRLGGVSSYIDNVLNPDTDNGGEE